MKRPNRNVEIFSLSAIDLFASAMGAFIVFSAILIPYYPNMKNGGETVARLDAEIEASRKNQQESEETRKKALEEQEQRIREAQKAQARAKAVEQARARLVSRTKQIEEGNKATAESVATLRTELDNLKKRNAAFRSATPERDTDFSILGITSKKKSFVIVVDLSGSMKSSSDIVTNTLREIIAPFHDKISFAILGYQNAGVTRFFPPIAGKLAQADGRSKIGARAFINILPPTFAGSTPTKAAMKFALDYSPQAIILISDGEPTDATIDSTINEITQKNGGRTEIHTVAIGDYLKHTDLIQFLNRLAKQNKGKFVGVIR